MTDTDQLASSTQPVGIDPEEPLDVKLYVRPDASPISTRRVDDIEHRLRELSETPLVADVERKAWPPHESSAEDDQPTREDLVGEFEAWAEENGLSLRPAVRRQPVPTSLTDTDSPDEKVRVPIVTLALYAEDSLEVVIPYTADPDSEDAETYTVDDWLSAAEEAATTNVTERVRPVETTDSTA